MQLKPICQAAPLKGRYYKFVCVLGLVFSFLMPLGLQANDRKNDSELVKVQLLCEKSVVAPGDQLWLAIHFQTAPDWHIYWKNSGDAGAATQLKWQLPEGVSVGEVRWPAPAVFEEGGIKGFGYQGPVTILAPVTLSTDLKVGQNVEIKLDVDWVACSTSCVPGSAQLLTHLPVQEKALLESESVLALFEQAQNNLPAPLQVLSAHLNDSHDSLRIDLPQSQCLSQIYFVPQEPGWLDSEKPQLQSSDENGCSLQLPLMGLLKPGIPFKGLLMTHGLKSKGSEIQLSIIDHGGDSNGHKGSILLIAIASAFLGGLLLNLMPCVLPVLSLKIMSMIQGQEAKGKRRQACAYTAGVVLSFWVLSGFLMILQMMGHLAGWGFHLQEPGFVAFLIGLFFLIGLNLLGVFEFGTKLTRIGGLASSKSGILPSFCNGILAVIVATPCTGPFLGTALGVAFTLPFWQTFLIFTFLGLGLALPYLLIAYIPFFQRFLPKPGQWMITFKQVMGFLIMASVVWLIWVFGMQTGVHALALILGALLLLSLGAWLWNHFGQLSSSVKAKVFSIFSVCLLVLSAGWITYKGIGSFSSQPLAKRDLSKATSHITLTQKAEPSSHLWEEYSEERFNQLQQAGRPILIDFTASWCLVCQANYLVLHSDDVLKTVADKNVACLRADWTKQDPEITKALARHGRNGVPLYLLYTPSGEVYILPQILTKHLLLEYLQQLP